MPSQRQIRLFREIMFQGAESGCKALLSRFGRIKNVEKKGRTDLVTDADRASEKAIIRMIRRAYPAHEILGEESGVVPGDSTAEFRWVVDPLDGTSNFAHGNPNFCVSIALQHHDKTILGLVVDPMRDEWFFAQRDRGALLNRRRIAVTKTAKLADALFITGFPHARHENLDHLLGVLRAFLDRSHGVLRLGAAALDLCWVAAGRAEGFWEERLHPWDVAAGALIVEEAGGRSTDFDAKRSKIDDPAILATNGKVHKEALRLIMDNYQGW